MARKALSIHILDACFYEVIVRHVFFFLPMYLFFAVVALLFIVALSCKPENQQNQHSAKPAKTAPTFTPEEQAYRACLIKLTRTNRTDGNLDRAVLLCREEVGR